MVNTTNPPSPCPAPPPCIYSVIPAAYICNTCWTDRHISCYLFLDRKHLWLKQLHLFRPGGARWDNSTVMVMLPRNEKQGRAIREAWPEFLETDKLIIPRKAVDGLNLTWHSDLVVSGGGTMIREAAALGVPAYSIFGGKTGCVDSRLAQAGRLKLIADSADIPTTILLEKRDRQHTAGPRSDSTRDRIVDELEDVIKRQECATA
jgi:hypothetical protein